LPTNYSSSPSLTLPGQVLGAPVRLPAFMCCTQGERWCGWKRTANTQKQFVEMAAEKRRHEQDCLGGLIVVRG
jgi:hypothetical protein